jgi:hypothetical protein
MTALGTDSDSPGGAKRHTRHSETIHNYCQYLGSDCQSGVCLQTASFPGGSGTACYPASCSDGIKDGGETDVDCGSPMGSASASWCPGCANGKPCLTASDCSSLACADAVCVFTAA